MQVLATDTVGQSGGGRPVDVDGAPGYLVEESHSVSLRWNPDGDDSEARLTAFGLDGEEVLAFARALDRREAGGTPGTSTSCPSAAGRTRSPRHLPADPPAAGGR